MTEEEARAAQTHDPDAVASPDRMASLRRELDEAEARLKERVVESRTIYRGHYMNFRVDSIERPDGSRGTRDLCDHPGAVAILALDEQQRLLMVCQYRIAPDRALLEIPAGTLDRDDNGVEDPDHAAPRELEEETGYRAGKMEKVAAFWTAPGFATEFMTLYLATELTAADDDRLSPDEDENLEIVRLGWREALAAVEAGLIADAKSILGILWLARRLDQAGPEATKIG